MSPEGREPVLHALLRAWLAQPVVEHRPSLLVEVVGPPHAPVRTSTSTATTTPAPDPDPEPEPEAEPECEADPECEAEPECEADPEPASSTPLSRLLEEGATCLARAAAAARDRDRAAAAQAWELAAFARLRPTAQLDRAADEIGAAAAATRAARPEILTEISEWAVDEVMAALGLTSRAAEALLVEAVTLAEQLPATLAAAERGELPWAHARMLAEVLPRLLDPAVRARVEAELLAGAAGRTVAQLRVAARRAVVRADPAAAAWRAAAALRERAVRLFAGDDGLATLATTVPGPVAAAIYARIEALAAAAATPGDERTKPQRMADCLVDLLLGHGNQPPVQVQLTLVATVETLRGGDEPGEVDGHLVPAAMVRELAYTLGLLPRPSTGPHARPDRDGQAAAEAAGVAGADADSDADAPSAHAAGSDPPTGGAPATVAPVDRAADSDAAAGRTADIVGAESTGAPTDQWSIYDQLAADVAGLLGVRQTTDSPFAGLPQIAVIDELSGQLLALTDAGELRRAADCGRARCRRRGRCPHPPRGPGLGPPPDTEGYRSSAPLDRYVRARDRRCRFPGCRARPMRCDLDHNVPWPAGPTSHDNLCCLCRHHHRLAHQAPGWHLRRLPDGGLAWTTPGGQTLITHPPRYGTDDQPPVEKKPPAAEPPLTAAERVLGRPARPGDDPAPF